MVNDSDYAATSPDARCQYIPMWVREAVKEMQPHPTHPSPTKPGAALDMCLCSHFGGF